MSQTYGKTSWKRFALVMVPSIAATAAIGVGLASSALAASFSVSGQDFKVTVADLDGTNFAQYGGVDNGLGAKHPIAVSAFDTATLTNLCQSVTTDLSALHLGTWTLKLKAGGDGTPATATNMLIGLENLSADATFDNPDAAGKPQALGGINIGQDASTVGGFSKGQVGGFGQYAPHAHLTNVKQTAWSTSAGTFKLPGLHLSVAQKDGNEPGNECY
ncbi:DUF6230 family protein [Kitasatospora sp. NPDC002227]|uniref:DUF6230 family protein n=1 Tax=Kitasatospora sp. NPDC002227 TaxID=3154773 RepID=UPI00331B9B0F